MKAMSESEEMYLITIARLAEEGLDTPIPLSQLADKLAVVPVSANQMVKKLDEANLVHYTPYKGVDLTPAGWQVARRVLRHRRLWEVFLVENLGLPLEEADALACRLEHFTSPEVAERLSHFLGQPAISPQGKSIPSSDRETLIEPAHLLSDLEAGQEGVLVSIEGTGQRFLEAEGLQAGATLRVLAKSAGGQVLVATSQQQISLSREVADQIMVNTGSNRFWGHQE